MEQGGFQSEAAGQEAGLKTPSSAYTDQDLSEDLENWMGRLPEKLRRTPIVHLAIPGSHDSGSYAITPSSALAPDAEYYLQKMKWVGRPLMYFVSKWARTQSCNPRKQMQLGVRFFDLRVATRPGDALHIVHGQYAEPVADVLLQISRFLDEHDKEMVILDCQHFYQMNQNDHRDLINTIVGTFGKKLVPLFQGYHMLHLTLDYMAEHNYQVLVVYRENHVRHPFFPSGCYPTPWPETTSGKELVKILSDNLKFRNDNYGYVTQFILTPTGYTIFKHLFGDLKSFGAESLYKQKMDWVRDQSPGHNGVNVVIGDFVEILDLDFSRSVVDLNRKLLEKPSDHPTKMLPPVTA